jgi:hypothetical protein
MDELEGYISECGGVQPPHLAFYMEAIRFNTEAAISSIEFVHRFIEMTNKTKGHYDMTDEMTIQVLDNIQNLLIHAGALSRFFWPSKSGLHMLHKKRAETLRSFFNLSDDSPLKNRKLRNQLEHLDENLDNYLWSKPIVGFIIPAFVGGESNNNDIPTHIFRAFYIDSGVFETLGQRFELQPIIDELCSIYDRLNGEDS